eukprot:350436-Chlamydomonas_euryale.AAC.22
MQTALTSVSSNHKQHADAPQAHAADHLADVSRAAAGPKDSSAFQMDAVNTLRSKHHLPCRRAYVWVGGQPHLPCRRAYVWVGGQRHLPCRRAYVCVGGQRHLPCRRAYVCVGGQRNLPCRRACVCVGGQRHLPCGRCGSTQKLADADSTWGMPGRPSALRPVDVAMVL